MVRSSIIACLLACTTFCANAQQNNDALEMHVTINGTQTAKMVVNGNETEIELKGTLVLPKNAFKLIEYKNKQLPGLEAVDLGLSVKWASKNFFQDPSKSELGELFPVPKDGDPVLNSWGKFGHWRMPTEQEMVDLINNCIWSWDTVNDVEGYWVCHPDDINKSDKDKRRIFLPAVGRQNPQLNSPSKKPTEYWTYPQYENAFWYLTFEEDYYDLGDTKPTFLRAIRPVWSEEEIPVYTVEIKDLNVSKTGASFTIEITGSEIPEVAKCYFKWGDTNEMKNSSTPVSPKSNTVAMVLDEHLIAGKTYYFQAVLELESGEKIESYVESRSIPATVLEIKSNSIKDDDISESTATISMSFTGAYASISSYGILYTSNEGKKDALIKGTNDTDILVVTQNGKPSSPVVNITLSNLLPNTTYYYKSFACINNELVPIRYGEVDSFKTLEAEYFEPNDSFPRPPKAVDLGLPSGIKWSPWNMGGSEPTDTGGYYGWGDVTGKVMELNDAYYADGKKTIGDIAGTEYDIATYQWKGQWRMPQRKDFEELYNYCDIKLGKWENKGEKGWIVVNKSKTDSIFIPLAGYKNWFSDDYEISGAGDVKYCYYWTSEADLEDSDNPYRFSFISSSYYNIASRRRYELYPIRPVYGPVNTWGDQDPVIPYDGEDLSLKIAGYDENYTTAIPADGVDLGLPSGTKWAAWNVGAMNYGEMGHYYAFGDQDSVERNQYLDSNYNPSDAIKNYPVNVLSANDDIASRLWKGDWRMPTVNDIGELLDYTTYDNARVYKYVDFQWTLDSLKDEKGNFLKDEYGNIKAHWGYKITSKINGNSIFLPAGGLKTNSVHSEELQGHYWTACGSEMSGKKRTNAVQVFFSEQDKPYTSSLERFIGCLVRPVRSKK